jgi:GT2 family glycosyltransferase
MDISVIIPTHARAAKLAQCLRALAVQTLEQSRFEVLVGLDGPDQDTELMAADVWLDERAESLRVIECPRAGTNATRNRLLAAAQGRYALFLNDDCVPMPDFVAVHLHEQETAAGHGGALISGYAPWRIFRNDTLFDRIVRETSLIFFYDQMFEPGTDAPRFGPGHDWGYRHWWTLNASAPLAAVREVGGFLDAPLGYGYDDIELAYRLCRRRGLAVLFRPRAVALHDHRYDPREILDREFRLGQAAWHYAKTNAEFAASLFGRDVRSEEELAYSREFILREQDLAERLETAFIAMTGIPGEAVDQGASEGGPHAGSLVNLAYQQHLLLKRWQWRRGLLEASERTLKTMNDER